MSDALTQSLSKVVRDVRSCRFDVGSAGDAIAVGTSVPVMLVGTGYAAALDRDTLANSTCADGYRKVDATHIELCDATCTKFRSDPVAELRLYNGCRFEALVERT